MCGVFTRILSFMLVSIVAILVVSGTPAYASSPPSVPHNGCTTPTGSVGQGGTFDFRDACNKHDHCYITHKDVSGKVVTRDTCDAQFYRNMTLWCAKHLGAGNGAADFCYLVSRSYYQGVRTFGA